MAHENDRLNLDEILNIAALFYIWPGLPFLCLLLPVLAFEMQLLWLLKACLVGVLLFPVVIAFLVISNWDRGTASGV